MIETLEILLLAMGVSGAAGWYFLRSPSKPKIKYRCPWQPCGYPLPESPLVEKPETSTHYATYAEEECEGCGKPVKFNAYTGEYDRIKPKKGKKDE